MKNKHLIDTDASPKIPSWATLVEHKTSGQIEWQPEDFNLYLSEKQKTGWITGNNLRKELANEPTMNINVAQYLVDHPELYPEEWKGKYVYFWGTIVRDSGGDLGVPCLVESGGGVVLGWHWLDNYWGAHSPALRFSKSLELKPSISSPLTLGASAPKSRKETIRQTLTRIADALEIIGKKS